MGSTFPGVEDEVNFAVCRLLVDLDVLFSGKIPGWEESRRGFKTVGRYSRNNEKMMRFRPKHWNRSALIGGRIVESYIFASFRCFPGPWWVPRKVEIFAPQILLGDGLIKEPLHLELHHHGSFQLNGVYDYWYFINATEGGNPESLALLKHEGLIPNEAQKEVPLCLEGAA